MVGQYATVLNHVEDVVEARVPVRMAHYLGYMAGVIRVDEIVPPQVDAITSEGTTVHKSPAWNAVGLDGSGIKVGIIDGGFKDWSLHSPSELPTPSGVRCYVPAGGFTDSLSDCEVDTVHGTAVAEAVDDIAPGVEFYISNPKTHADLLATANWMASNGVKVINMSMGWTWSGSGDGTTVYSSSAYEAIESAVGDGILWVNSAGNSALSHWKGDYIDTDSDGWLEFSAGDELNGLSAVISETDVVELRWEDAWPGAQTDLDLYLYDGGLSYVTLSLIHI